MGNNSLDISMDAIWNAWITFRRGKKASQEILVFESHLLDNLTSLHKGINQKVYKHGFYRRVKIFESKRRDLAIASVRDRVVHRLLYDYLVRIYDKRFIFDAWSCRRGKGLFGCIERTKVILRKNYRGYFWRSDIIKFFDHVNHDRLKELLRRCFFDQNALYLLDEIIESYEFLKVQEREREL